MSLIFSTPAPIERGDIFGQLKVLELQPNGKYRCGCTCGRQDEYRASRLMRAGGVRKCSRCRKKPACKDSFPHSQQG